MDVTIQELGSLGELIAAIATVATLIYLAIQIRANTASVRAESRRDAVAQTNGFAAVVANNKELASVFRRGIADYEALDADEQVQFQFLFAMVAATADSAHIEHRLGTTDRKWFESSSAGFRRLVATPGGQVFWRLNRHTFSSEFTALIDEELSR